ncbi:glycosyltransferase [Riemerella columbina]|uniref:glycosyltransferase n=1 Tax=Riemerella columbina TaxID=103810 RepID=UPI0003604918|nr:glycosyltransferase [Riemerella columbina]
MKIIVSAFSNLYTDQRIEKVCRTLQENGYTLELIGNNWKNDALVERPYPVKKIALSSKQLRKAYVEFNYKLYKELLSKADAQTILHANDLDALLPNYLVSKKLGIPLIYDSHEIFTEMPAIKGRWTQKVWQGLERYLMPRVKYMMTESESYAKWFDKQYHIKPLVIRNIPRKIPKDDISIPNNQPKVVLYQGAINQSRGLDKAIKAMHYLENVVFKIAGDGPKRQEYENLATTEGLNDKVLFLGNQAPDNLRALTKTADVGLSVEENGGVSYLYSLPNKVGDYIQSRVPLVMINFPEMKRVYEQHKVGELITSHEPKIIAEAVKKVLHNGRAYYQNALEQAASDLCWENDETKILNLYQKVIKENFY